jgi:hypothetical protein
MYAREGGRKSERGNSRTHELTNSQQRSIKLKQKPRFGRERASKRVREKERSGERESGRECKVIYIHNMYLYMSICVCTL